MALLIIGMSSMHLLRAQSALEEMKFTTNSDPRTPCKLRFGASVAMDVHFLSTGRLRVLDTDFPPRPGFSVNGWASLPLDEKFSLQFGLGYALRQHQLNVDSIVFSSDINPVTGVVTYSRMREGFQEHDLQLPILASFHPKGFDKGLFVSAGAVIGYTLVSQEKGEIVFGNGTVDNLNSRRVPEGIFLSGQMAVGHKLALQNGSSLGLELYGNAHLFEMRIFPARPFSAGLRASYWF